LIASRPVFGMKGPRGASDQRRQSLLRWAHSDGSRFQHSAAQTTKSVCFTDCVEHERGRRSSLMHRTSLTVQRFSTKCEETGGRVLYTCPDHFSPAILSYLRKSLRDCDPISHHCWGFVVCEHGHLLSTSYFTRETRRLVRIDPAAPLEPSTNAARVPRPADGLHDSQEWQRWVSAPQWLHAGECSDNPTGRKPTLPSLDAGFEKVEGIKLQCRRSVIARRVHAIDW
jgi:hypothetical protein